MQFFFQGIYAMIGQMPKRTYQPKKVKRQRKHGYMMRNANKHGRAVLKRRRLKGRKRITI